MSEMTALLEAVKRGALDEIRKIVADHPNWCTNGRFRDNGAAQCSFWSA